MKRLIPIFLFLIGGIALCFSLLVSDRPRAFFKEGNKITYTITAENGAKSYSVISIQSVTAKGSSSTSIFAKDQRQDDQRKSTFQYRLTYYSDSLHWAVDALNHLNIPMAYSSNYFVDLKSDSLVYPYNMKVGDTLLPASGSEILSGTLKNERHIQFLNRKVAAQENVMVNGESLQAFRIECRTISKSIADYGALGKIPTETIYTFTEWFVPSKGIVKSESKSNTGVTRWEMNVVQ